jgi:hypothetical protein
MNFERAAIAHPCWSCKMSTWHLTVNEDPAIVLSDMANSIAGSCRRGYPLLHRQCFSTAMLVTCFRGYTGLHAMPAVQVARTLGLKLLLLCSTDDDKVRSMWTACGFEYTQEEDVKRWRVHQGDLIYMTNTVQMHKHLPAKRKFRSIQLMHGAFVHRLYAPMDVPRGFAMQLVHEHEESKARKKLAVAKVVSKGTAASSGGAPLSRSIAPERAGSPATSRAALSH